jgi:hypothetical protein
LVLRADDLTAATLHDFETFHRAARRRSVRRVPVPLPLLPILLRALDPRELRGGRRDHLEFFAGEPVDVDA